MDNITAALSYVSRGGQKLEKALDHFKVSPQGRVCIDCGASTGGFTDCLLKNGARYVYAIDVGYGQLAWTLRNDPRVKVMERTNIRYVTPEMLDTRPTLATLDLSFISLSLVLPVVKKLMCARGEEREAGGGDDGEKGCEVICLIKPQFEAGKGKVGKKGVVRDPKVHEEVLSAFMKHAADSGLMTQGIAHSPVTGPKGNIEYLGHLASQGGGEAMESDSGAVDIKTIVAQAHEELG